MKTHERELIVYRILAGYTKCNIVDKIGIEHKLLLFSPTIRQLVDAQEIFNETYDEALEEGLFTEEQYVQYVLERGLWTLEDERRLGELPQEIEDLKVGMYESMTRSITRENLRQRLKERKVECSQLFAQKYKLNYLTAEGMAGMAKNYYITGQCVKKPDFSPYLIDYDSPNTILEEIIEFKNGIRISEDVYREIVRTDPWRSYWNCGNVFSECALNLTEEQRSLINTAKLLDNIMECPDCPATWVLEDNDLLDGWMISQRRKREAQQLAIEGESMIGEKAAKADMVFIPVETEEDNKRVDALNSPMAKMMKGQRTKILIEKQTVKEEEFPDQKLKMMGILKGN